MGLHLLFIENSLKLVENAPINCNENKIITETMNESKEGNSQKHSNENQPETEDNNEVNNLFHKIQCSLERVKPWMNELQQEAKRLQEAATLLGSGIINSFGAFINKLAEDEPSLKPLVQNNNVTPMNNSSTTASTTTMEIATTEQISEFLCPDGFIADHNGICERME